MGGVYGYRPRTGGHRLRSPLAKEDKPRAIVSTRKVKVKHYCYNRLIVMKSRVFLTSIALSGQVKGYQ